MKYLSDYEIMCFAYGRTLIEGGCSISMFINDAKEIECIIPTKGYVVGGRVPEQSIKSNNEPHFKHTFMNMMLEAEKLTKAGTDMVIGTWVEYRDDDTYIVFDFCDIIESKDYAIDLGNMRGERAIYDLENKKEIFLK